LILVTGTFGLFIQARTASHGLEAARTMAANTLVMCEVFYLINVRHILAPTLNFNGLFGNRIAIAAMAVVIGLPLLLTCLPVMNTLFGTAPLDAVDWLLVVLVSATVVPPVELEKVTLRRR
jgi:magnesium-transporting ATPase (P-type)